MIAEKCVIITGYDPNFNIFNSHHLTILANSSYYRYTGLGAPKGIIGMVSTTAPLVGIKSEKYMSISFFR